MMMNFNQPIITTYDPISSKGGKRRTRKTRRTRKNKTYRKKTNKSRTRRYK